MEQFPRDILNYIFKDYLTQWEWVRVKRVCKEWRTLIMNLWIPLEISGAESEEMRTLMLIEAIVRKDAFMDLNEMPTRLFSGAYKICSLNMARVLLKVYPNTHEVAIFQSCNSHNIPVAMYVLNKLCGNRLIFCIGAGLTEAIMQGLDVVVDKMLSHMNMKDPRIYSGLKLITSKNVHVIASFLKKGHLKIYKVMNFAMKDSNEHIIKFLINNYNKPDANYYFNIACRMGVSQIVSMIINNYKVNMAMGIKLATLHGNDYIVNRLRNYTLRIEREKLANA